VNHVLLVGRLEQDPEPRTGSNGAEALLRLAVRRREPGGGPEPGITSLEILVPWPQSREADHMQPGELVAVSGLIDRNEFRDATGQLREEQRVIADWLERL
jgi:single-stranded DNA-binding protein